MNRNLDPEVQYTAENIKKCMCPECPVQVGSKCVSERLRNSKEEMERLGRGMVPDPEIMPGIYCSIDIATCTDIDTSKPCICGTCAVYQAYGLADERPNEHFCKNGRVF